MKNDVNTLLKEKKELVMTMRNARNWDEVIYAGRRISEIDGLISDVKLPVKKSVKITDKLLDKIKHQYIKLFC